ncbi:TlpA disulfide reductase family protein [uncultured Polaribacter sp.]|uniref:TlpA family protein disulfide reductase n=1 Tax=uncultured Polaribacter sp. TaxID=174711 RepID=UPI00259BD5CE|nr:TlpA disulfide reductase family protein [uncultured Polaribacter sp.]
MKKKLILLFILLNNTLFAKSGKVYITGNVENKTIENITISHLNHRVLITAKLDDNGNFEMSTKLEQGYYFLEYGRSTAYVYLFPKDKIYISFDANNFEKTLNFTGTGSNRNNYLAIKSIEEKELTDNLEVFYKVDENRYLENIQKVKNIHLKLLEEYNVEHFFKKIELKSLEYERLLSIKNFESNHKFYLGEEISTSENFKQPIKDLDINNLKEYKNQPYYRYIVNSYWSKELDKADNIDDMFKVLRRVPSQEIGITLINGCFSKLSSDKGEMYLKFFRKVVTHKPFLEAAEKKFEESKSSKKNVKGVISHKFSYEDNQGKIVSIDDFKGKYIYIDIWATWCAPCIKQVPYLKKLEERYRDKNIVFISISVDKEKKKKTWKNFIEKKELGGIQLFADNSFDSEFMNAYNVKSIPRFILIDDKGKILDPEAPRPSFQKTIELLDDILK